MPQVGLFRCNNILRIKISEFTRYDSPGPNIFPALNLVSGNVTILPCNDFNCSKLVSQWQDNIIHNLFCYGTDNGTTNAALTKGAQAGIGVGVGIFILVLIAAGTWLFRARHQKRLSNERDQAQPAQQNNTQPSLPEVSGKGVVREKPDDHLRALHVAPSEIFGHQVHELSLEVITYGIKDQSLTA
ncbi:hypothetical protein GGR51DRAFT_576752 [Nemania sp. FL0031]|nr:hypothetical protein GGR51DRAFT_576752 [Nemania sp. FL0031]